MKYFTILKDFELLLLESYKSPPFSLGTVGELVSHTFWSDGGRRRLLQWLPAGCRRGLGHGSSDRGAAVGRDGEDCGGQMKEVVAE